MKLAQHVMAASCALGLGCGGSDDSQPSPQSDAGAESSMQADGATEASDSTTSDAVLLDAPPGWGCVTVKDTCVCGMNPPAGVPIDPLLCAVSSAYSCCEWNSELCTCKTDGYCPLLEDAFVMQCGQIYSCTYPLVEHGDPCTQLGLQCPGKGSDWSCWGWSCTCHPQGWNCGPSVCS